MSSVDGRMLPSRWTQPFGNTDPSELFMKYTALARQLGSDGSASSPSIFEYLGAPGRTFCRRTVSGAGFIRDLRQRNSVAPLPLPQKQIMTKIIS